MTRNYNTQGQTLPPKRITLREDQPAGVCIEGVDYFPGDTFEAPHGIATQLLGHGRAVEAPDPVPAEELGPEQEPEPLPPEAPVVPETRDPKPTKRR